MKTTRVSGIKISGIASAVPDVIYKLAEDADVFGTAEIEKISSTTGIRERRVAPTGVCTSDLCLKAAEQLLGSMSLDVKTIDALILVTQTPDYPLPATACSLHSRLGLPDGCAAFDVNLGCSGYTYGLWLASHLIAGGAANRVLLLAGETATRRINAFDRSAKPLFGDAGTATILETDSGAGEIGFVLGTDGAGQNDLMIPAGGLRLPACEVACESKVYEDGNPRRLIDLYMDGSAVFVFTLNRVIPLIKSALKEANWDCDSLDFAVLHQANEFMLKHIAKSVKIPWSKVPCSLRHFGNTSSASIPLTMTTQMCRDGVIRADRLLLAGFGVGLSWCSATINNAEICSPPLLEVDTKEMLANLYNPPAESATHLPHSIRSVYGSW